MKVRRSAIIIGVAVCVGTTSAAVLGVAAVTTAGGAATTVTTVGGAVTTVTTVETIPTVAGLSNAVVDAVNSTNMTIVLSAISPPTTAISEATAEQTVLAQLPPGSVVEAASLVELTDGLYPTGRLAWGVSSNPAGDHSVAGGVFVGKTAPPQFNFRVDFVDASTGQWLQADMGADPNLPALPVIPITAGEADGAGAPTTAAR